MFLRSLDNTYHFQCSVQVLAVVLALALACLPMDLTRYFLQSLTCSVMADSCRSSSLGHWPPGAREPFLSSFGPSREGGAGGQNFNVQLDQSSAWRRLSSAGYRQVTDYMWILHFFPCLIIRQKPCNVYLTSACSVPFQLVSRDF